MCFLGAREVAGLAAFDLPLLWGRGSLRVFLYEYIIANIDIHDLIHDLVRRDVGRERA